MFERPTGGEKAILVHIDFTVSGDTEALDEFQELCLSAGAERVAVLTATRKNA